MIARPLNVFCCDVHLPSKKGEIRPSSDRPIRFFGRSAAWRQATYVAGEKTVLNKNKAKECFEQSGKVIGHGQNYHYLKSWERASIQKSSQLSFLKSLNASTKLLPHRSKTMSVLAGKNVTPVFISGGRAPQAQAAGEGSHLEVLEVLEVLKNTWENISSCGAIPCPIILAAS